MKKSYILTGNPKEVDKVIRENRIRVNRGVISFTPVEPEPETELTLDSPDSPEKCNNSGENIPINGNIDGDIIPGQSEDVETESENPGQMDDKTLEVEDLKEVDFDIDDKTLEADDSKDVPATDTKETKTAKKTSTRSSQKSV